MNRKIAASIAGLAVVAAIGIITVSTSHSQKVPQVTYTSIKGEQRSTDSFKGKVVLINFWATSCTGCVKEMPKLVDTYNKFQARGYETVAVAMSYDSPNYVANFTEQRKLPFFVALDTTGEIAQKFGGIQLTPTSILVDKNGQIIQRFIGEPDFAQLEALIERKLKETA